MEARIRTSETAPMFQSIQAPHRLGQIGFGIVLAAFIIALVNILLPSPNKVVGSMLQPLIFVGIASLLYHIGQHLHMLHMNVIRMARMESGSPTEEAD